MTKRVCVIEGDDAAPEAVRPSVEILMRMGLDLEFLRPPSGEEAIAKYGTGFPEEAKQAIDTSDTTLFGASSGKSTAIGYLRQGKRTFANIRPVKWMKGFRSPLSRPEGIDYIIVRENLEGLYPGREGELSELKAMKDVEWASRQNFDVPGRAKYAVRVITEENTRNIAEFACKLALKRKAKGKPGKVTCTSKYNAMKQSDGLFREVVEETVAGYPELKYEQFIVDDFARRLVAVPHDFDVVVMPNEQGDILSDAAAGTLGGLGLAPSGCYSANFAYFEPVHGTAPDIAGMGIINPTATLLSAVMMLEYLGLDDAASRLERAVAAVYEEGKWLTPDQGGRAKTTDFCKAIEEHLG